MNYVMIAIKVPSELAARIKRNAQEEDRSMSSYLRRLLTKSIQSDCNHVWEVVNDNPTCSNCGFVSYGQ